MNNDTFGKRLKNLIKIKGITVTAFANLTGLSQPNFYKYFKDESLPTIALVQKIIEEWPDTNLYWLLTGEGEPLATEAHSVGLTDNRAENKLLKQKVEELETAAKQQDKLIAAHELTISSQEKSLDMIIAMLKERGIDVYEDD